MMRTPLAWTLRVTISPVNSFEPVFLKVPMVAILSLRFPFPSPHHCGLDGDRKAGDDHWRTPKRVLDSRGRSFLSPRGMAGPADRGRKSNDAVAPKRSKRNALFFGQIRPLKRPFGAVETRDLNGDGGAPEATQDDRNGNHWPMSPRPQAMPVLSPGLHSTGVALAELRDLAGRGAAICPALLYRGSVRSSRRSGLGVPIRPPVRGTADCLCSILIPSSAPCGINMQETFVRMDGYHMPILHGKAFMPSGSAPTIRSLLSVRCGRSVSARSRGKTDVEGGKRPAKLRHRTRSNRR